MTVKKNTFVRTHYHTKKTTHRLADVTIPQGTSSNINSTTSAPGSGTATTGKAEHIKDIPIGVRYGYIDKIDYSKANSYIYHVMFPDTKTDVWARKIGNSSLKSLPKTKSGKDLIALEDVIWVGVSIEYNSLTWVIIGEAESDEIPESGTIRVGYKDSYIEISEDGINIVSPKVKINGEEL